MPSPNASPLSGKEMIRGNQGGESVWLDPADVGTLLDKAGALAAPIAAAVGPAIPGALATLGQTPSPQAARTAGQGGNFNPARPTIWIRDQSFIMVGDRATLQDDIDNATYDGKALIGDPSATTVLSSGFNLYANTKTDLRKMRFATSGSFNTGAVCTILPNIGFSDTGYIKGLRLQLVANGGAADFNKTMTALRLGTDQSGNAGFIRQLVIDDMYVSGCQTGIDFYGGNLFIITVRNSSFVNLFGRGITCSSPNNSGEKFIFDNCVFSGISNTYSAGNPGAILEVLPGSVDPAFMFNGCSLDYSDIGFILPRGKVVVDEASWYENNNMFEMARISRTSGRPPVSFAFRGEFINGPLGGGNGVPKETDRASGRPALITTQGNGHHVEFTGNMPTYKLKRNTEILRNLDGGVLGRVIIAPYVDAGYVMTGNAKLGIGAPPVTSHSRNRVFLNAAGAVTVGWQTASGITSSTTKMLARTAGSFLNTQTTATSGFITPDSTHIVPVQAGDICVWEAWFHTEAITAGKQALRMRFYAEAAKTNLVGESIELDGQTTISPISSTSATITIPIAAYPTVGTFAPGTLQQGTFVVGQELSWTGQTKRCYITRDNADGTFEVFLGDGAAVAATTIYGWDRQFIRNIAPSGAAYVEVGILSTGFNGTNYTGAPHLSVTQ